jgi:lysophospholipase L1-like esterase
MLGINDRQPFRESQSEKKDKAGKDKDAGKKAEPDKAAAPDNKPAVDKQAAADPKIDDEQPSMLAPEPRSAGGAKGVTDFRTERWEEIYTKRIDETIAALKSKGVPVIWVGLPPIRGTRSTSDVVYLNDLYRARAEKAGIVYVDVWDGFADEAGKFTTRGPDFEGQMRNLRSGDGVHFTKYGARKIAHYVERELRRFISNRAMPMALPAEEPAGPMTPDGRPGAAVRPVAGVVVPLTASPGSETDELLGGNAVRPTHTDPTATKVLVKGEPVAPPPGRADDFAWPRPGDANAAVEPLSPIAAAARGEPEAPKKAKDAPKDGKKGKADAKTDAKAKANQKPKLDQRPARSPQQQHPSGGPFGWLR